MKKCTNNLILTAAGVLLYNCDKTSNAFAGLTLASASITTVNTAIADGSLIYLPFLKSADAISNNSEDASVATDGVDTMQVNSPRIGINAMLSARFGTLLKALKSSGSLGYVVCKDGSLIGDLSEDGDTLNMLQVAISTPSPLPNTPFVNSTNMPNVQVQINFGSVEKVAEWRPRAISGLTSSEDLLELEEAELIATSTTTAKLVDFMGNTITGANDVSNAGFVYSTGSPTASISSGVITFTTTTAGCVVTAEGSISGYRIVKPIVMPS